MQSAADPAVPLAPARNRRAWLHGLALVVGVGALALLISRTGIDGLTGALGRIGPWFAAIVAIDLCVVSCDAGALHAFARVHGPVDYKRVFAAQASGIAINRLTPGNIAGEPIKVTMLMSVVPRAVAVSTVVMFNLMTSWVAISTIVIGVPITLLSLELPLRAEIAVWIATGVLIAFALAMVVVVRRGAIGVVIDGTRKLALISEARATQWHTSVEEIDAHIRGIGGHGVRRAVLFVIASRVLFSTGTACLILASGIEVSPTVVIATMSVGLLVTWMSNIIPLGLGLADGGNYALYGALGATGGAGLVYTMVNRARVFLLALTGLTVMALASAFPPPSSEEARR